MSADSSPVMSASNSSDVLHMITQLLTSVQSSNGAQEEQV